MRKLTVLAKNDFNDLSRLYDLISQNSTIKDTIYIDTKESQLNSLIEEVSVLLHRTVVFCPRATKTADAVLIIYDKDHEIHELRKDYTNKYEMLECVAA
jgi:hypothetical protein